jgi:peptidoglycan/xylan/chitin deacetylase (PgdA/CDA1 family)
MLHVPTRRTALATFLIAIVLLAGLTGCGGKSAGRKIAWNTGTPPSTEPAPPPGSATQPPETAAQDRPSPSPSPTVPPAPSPTAEVGATLTPEQLQQLKPNELGFIPVLEYHNFVTDPADEAQFARPLDDFRADLQWLYEHDFYVIPLRDLILNRIAAPAGKRPVVLTFDDSYASQFRVLIEADGTWTIDPNSAVGILEAFFAAHPDFGRGGFFAVIPGFCFDWLPDRREDDQTAYCAEKISWLLDHGYEIGNHSLDHVSLYDVTDDEFKRQIGGAIEALQAYDPRVTADIIAMPYGDYPDRVKHPQQRKWLRDGFTYNGRTITILGCLMVGANPTESPASTEFDPVWIARIQAFDGDVDVRDAPNLYQWFDRMMADPDTVYVSDGNPDTITVPEQLPVALAGTLDEAKLEAEGKTVIRY